MPVNLTKTTTSLSRDAVAALAASTVGTVYVHVPFCASKCQYCDFYSIAGDHPSLMEAYVAGVEHELGWWKSYLAKTHSRIATIFLGGGTPTLLPPPLMRRLLCAVRGLGLAENYEWTIEANPATIDDAYCRMMLEEGANRLSLGAQSLIDSELQTLGRIHTAAEVIESVRIAQAAGFSRLSIDLMYATPGQTLTSWGKTLEGAVSLGIGHLSCYCLTLEEHTPMYRRTMSGEIPQVPEETQLRYMQLTRQVMAQQGYDGYEISNYARPGEECRHNLVYWDCGNYIGAGPGAATHINGLRWRHAPNVQQYTTSMSQSDSAPLVDVEQLTPAQRATELIMMSLRTTRGLHWGRLAAVSGIDGARVLAPAIRRLEELSLLQRSDSGIRLTPKGIYVADEVIGELVREAD